MKICIGLCLVIVMMAALVASACTPKSDTTPTPSPTPSPSPEPAPAPAPVKLIFAATDPEDSVIADAYRWWESELNKRTNDAVDIEWHWNNSLVVMPEMLEAVTSGVADMGNFVPPYFGNVFALHGALDSIILFSDKPLAKLKANEALDREIPEAAAEWEKAGLVRLNSWGPFNYHMSSIKPIRTLDDFKGIKIRATGPINPVILKAAGAVPVGFTHNELYDALMKGTVDGSLTDYDLMYRFKEAEITPYVTRLFVAADPMLSTAINMDAWNKLSPEVQQVMLDLRDEFPDIYAEYGAKQFLDVSIPKLYEDGIEIIDLPPADLEAIQTDPSVLAIRDGWVDWVLERKPELSRERAEEIKQFFSDKVQEYNEVYTMTLEPEEIGLKVN
ncbi:MAG: TRAP transporter substrate-binding protein DctP [Dehalococcoidia bacterium]